jgi:hypothetical protein
MQPNSLYLFFLGFTFSFVFAQDNTIEPPQNFEDQSKFRIGFNLGPNYNSFRNNQQLENADPGLNFFGGASFEYRLTEKFSFVTNVNYELKSFKSTYGVTDIFNQPGGTFTTVSNPGQLPGFQFPNVNITETTRFHYINIPVLARFYLGQENQFFVNAGFFYNRLIDVNTERETSEALSSSIIFISPDQFFTENDFGSSIGVGTNFKIGFFSRLFLELRYDIGLSNIVENIEATYSNSLKLVANWSFDIY